MYDEIIHIKEEYRCPLLKYPESIFNMTANRSGFYPAPSIISESCPNIGGTGF
jgi:hypothetical protein